MAVSISPGLKGIKTVRDFELNGKTVFLRLDLNVPIENGKITEAFGFFDPRPILGS